MQPDKLDLMIKTYSRLKHRSFRLIEKTLKILEEDIGFSKERVSSSITVLLLLLLLLLFFFCLLMFGFYFFVVFVVLCLLFD